MQLAWTFCFAISGGPPCWYHRFTAWACFESASALCCLFFRALHV